MQWYGSQQCGRWAILALLRVGVPASSVMRWESSGLLAGEDGWKGTSSQDRVKHSSLALLMEAVGDLHGLSIRAGQIAGPLLG
jgi:hypothetical protein